MKSAVLLFFAGLMCLAGAGVGHAADHNAIKSCYDLLRISGKNEVAKKEIFVIIDQTTIVDDKLKHSVLENVQRHIAFGNAVVVIGFSAFMQGHYTSIIVSGKLDDMMSDSVRYDTSKSVLREFDKCMGAQQRFANKLFTDNINATFSKPTESIAKSDILKSLQEIAQNAIKLSSSKEKLVLIVSDMLENSTITSFYASNSVRKIEPDVELKKVISNNLLADFGGAKVYVLGAGLVLEDAKPSQSSNHYRDPKTMKLLASFWQSYFQKSNAVLVELGQPALLGKVE